MFLEKGKDYKSLKKPEKKTKQNKTNSYTAYAHNYTRTFIGARQSCYNRVVLSSK